MAKAKTSQKQEKYSGKRLKVRDDANLIPYDPVKEILDENFIGKAVMECLSNNDPEGVMEVIGIYLRALEKVRFLEASQVPKSTLYHSLRSKNPTIKTLAKLVHATTIESRK